MYGASNAQRDAQGDCAGYLTHPWAFAGRDRLTSRVIPAFAGMGPPTVRK